CSFSQQAALHSMEEFELEPGEKIILQVRKHWVVLAGQLLPYVILAIIPFLIPPFLSFVESYNTTISATLNAEFTQASAWFRLALALWWLFIWMVAFGTFTR